MVVLCVVLACVMPARAPAGTLSPPPGGEAHARPHGVAGGAPSPRAAQQALSAARSAQTRFERLRRQWSPARRHPWLGTDCDEIVGRVCLRYDEGGDWWPGSEDPRITQARLELLEALEAAQAERPDDVWILGQRVHYLGEAGLWQDAEALSRACPPADPEWCGHLLGFSLHGQGRFPEAERAFRSALAGADAEGGRRDWTDPGVLLDDEGLRHLRRAESEGPAARAAALERIWRLADPLYLVDGNDRLTEHAFRWTVARMRENATSPYGLSWGRDLEEVLLRYGWEVGWDRVIDFSGFGREALVGHHHPESRRYVAPGSVLRDAAALGPDEWRLSPPRPRDGYAPPYAPVIIPADGELLRFPRGDHLKVVAVYRLPEDTTRHAHHAHPPFQPGPGHRDLPVQAGLFLVPIEGGQAGELRRAGAEAGAFLLEAPPGHYLASLEVWSPERGFAGRLRQGLRAPFLPPGLATLSDLLLLSAPLPDSATLEDAVAAAAPPGSVPSAGRIGLGWELFGFGAEGEPLSYTLSLTRSDTGLLRRLGQRLGVVRVEEPLRLEWQEAGPRRPGASFRSLAVELPELDPGLYLLRLELFGAARGLLVSERTLSVSTR